MIFGFKKEKNLRINLVGVTFFENVVFNPNVFDPDKLG